MRNKTRSYFGNDVQETAKQVSQGNSSVYELYSKLSKLNQDNLLQAYDQGYRYLFPNGLDKITPEQAYASYLNYPAQYQSTTDHPQDLDPSHDDIKEATIGRKYEGLLHQANYLRSRINVLQKIKRAFDPRYISNEQPLGDSIAVQLSFKPSAFYHLSEADLRARLNAELLGVTDYDLQLRINLPIFTTQKKQVSVRIIDGLDKKACDLSSANIDILFKN